MEASRAKEILNTLSSMADRDARRQAFADLEHAMVKQAKPFIPLARVSTEHGVSVLIYNRKFTFLFNPLTGQIKHGPSTLSFGRRE